MPIDYKKYPANWKTEIVPAIKKRANNCCEFCGLENYSEGVRLPNGEFMKCPDEVNNELQKFHCEAMGMKMIKIVLTVAHLDHDIKNNNYDNLKALCQRCHLRYDAAHHKKNARQTRNKKMGLIELF